MGRAPGVVVVLPRVGPWLDRDEPVAALVVSEASPRAGEVGVERGRVPVELVGVAARGVGLPDLDQAVPDRPPVAVRDAARDDDPLPQGLALVLAGQVVVQLPDRPAPVSRSGGIREGPWEDDQRLSGRPEARRDVVRVQVWRLPASPAQTCGFIGGLLSHPRFSSLAQAGFSTTIAMPCPTPMHIVASP